MKYFYTVLVTVVVVAGVCAYVFWSRDAQPILTNNSTSNALPNTQAITASTSTDIAETNANAAVALVNIPTPAGWKKIVETGPVPIANFNLVSIPTNSTTTPVIEVGFWKVKKSTGSTTSGGGSSDLSTSTQIWGSVNGYVILESRFPLRVAYNILISGKDSPDYRYTFDLTYAWTNGAMELAPGPFGPDDLQILQDMVKNFAESLPAQK